MSQWCSLLEPRLLMDLPIKAGTTTVLTSQAAAQVAKCLHATVKTLAARIPHPHIEVSANEPNLPPHDFVYFTSDFDGTHVDSANPMLETGPVDGVSKFEASVVISEEEWRFEMLSIPSARVAIAHLFPKRASAVGAVSNPINEAVTSTQAALDHLLCAQRSLALTTSERDELHRLRAEVRCLHQVRAELEAARAEIRSLKSASANGTGGSGGQRRTPPQRRVASAVPPRSPSPRSQKLLLSPLPAKLLEQQLQQQQQQERDRSPDPTTGAGRYSPPRDRPPPPSPLSTAASSRHPHAHTHKPHPIPITSPAYDSTHPPVPEYASDLSSPRAA